MKKKNWKRLGEGVKTSNVNFDLTKSLTHRSPGIGRPERDDARGFDGRPPPLGSLGPRFDEFPAEDLHGQRQQSIPHDHGAARGRRHAGCRLVHLMQHVENQRQDLLHVFLLKGLLGVGVTLPGDAQSGSAVRNGNAFESFTKASFPVSSGARERSEQGGASK